MFPNAVKQRNCSRVAHSPTKLFVVHWVHTDALLFAGNEYVLRVLSDRNQRAGFDIIVTMIFHKRLNSLAGKWLELYLVKDDEGVAFDQLHTIDQLKPQENIIKVRDIIEEVLDLL